MHINKIIRQEHAKFLINLYSSLMQPNTQVLGQPTVMETKCYIEYEGQEGEV